MKTIYIGFSRHKRFAIGSWAIQKFMNKPFSHTYFKFKEEKYTDHTIFHAVGKGMIYVAEMTFLEKNEIVAEFAIHISDELFDELLQDCHKNASRKYGYLQNLGVVIVRWAAKIGIKMKKNPINDGINCSEWIWWILQEVEGKWTETEPNLVGPDECYNYLVGRYKSSI